MKRYILLVEDNPDDVLLTQRAIKKSGLDVDVSVVRDGAEALDFLHGDMGSPDSVLPDLILLDLKLPKIDGLEVLKALRAEQSTNLLPVVILSTSNEENDIRTSYALGANSYIRKPVDFDTFTNTMSQIGEYWLKLNIVPTVIGE